MRDRFQREIDYIRISVTDKCNFRCRYCMPEEGVETIPHSEVLSFEEIVRVVSVLSELGIKKVKITGGEPLVRRDICTLIQKIVKISGIEDITLTTNGFLLGEMAEQLKRAGIRTINVSVDTLNRREFADICRRDGLDQVLDSIEKAKNLGLEIRINTTVSEESNLEELFELLEYFVNRDIPVRFIELMPIGCGHGSRVKNQDLQKMLKKRYPDFVRSNFSGNGPAVYYTFGKNKKVGFISAVHNKFCESCNRIRLSCDGKIKPCLASSLSYDIKAVLRSGGDDKKLKESLEQAIFYKPLEHHFGKEKSGCIKNTMNQIGG
jgi:molybdenum cofactor biosynthesis protein A